MRTILVDTQIALWILLESPHLPHILKEATLSEEFSWIFHQTSVWEIQIKYDLGKLSLPEEPKRFLPAAIRATGFDYRRIEDEAIFLLGKLPNHHRDPFDRLLMAHAIVEGWEIATEDHLFQKYPVRIFH